MLRNHGSHSRYGSAPRGLGAALAITALLAVVAFPAQLLAAPSPGGTNAGPSAGLEPWLDMILTWLGIPPAPPAPEDGLEPTSLPEGCDIDPLGICVDSNETSSDPTWGSPGETEPES